MRFRAWVTRAFFSVIGDLAGKRESCEAGGEKSRNHTLINLTLTRRRQALRKILSRGA
jgi:hypothetical protein